MQRREETIAGGARCFALFASIVLFLTVVPRLGRRFLQPVQLPDVRCPRRMGDALVEAIHSQLGVDEGLGVGIVSGLAAKKVG